MKVSFSLFLVAAPVLPATAFVGLSNRQTAPPSSSLDASLEQIPNLLLTAASNSEAAASAAAAFMEKLKTSSGADFNLDLSGVDLTPFKEYGPWALTAFAGAAAAGQRQAGYEQATEEIMGQIVSGKLDVEEVRHFMKISAADIRIAPCTFFN